jgi:putative intracellular protease/amidase
MIDLLDDPDAGTVMRHFHNTAKPTAVLCHGPISLLSALPNSREVVGALKAGDAAGARTKAQGWIYSGYKMTVFSTAEEQQREPLEIGGKVLFYPDFALRTAGADVSVVAPWGSYVLQDRELISGQNPESVRAINPKSAPARCVTLGESEHPKLAMSLIGPSRKPPWPPVGSAVRGRPAAGALALKPLVTHSGVRQEAGKE